MLILILKPILTLKLILLLMSMLILNKYYYQIPILTPIPMLMQTLLNSFYQHPF